MARLAGVVAVEAHPGHLLVVVVVGLVQPVDQYHLCAAAFELALAVLPPLGCLDLQQPVGGDVGWGLGGGGDVLGVHALVHKP